MNSSTREVFGQPELSENKRWQSQLSILAPEVAATTAFVTYLGLKSWNWGSSRFKFHDEGWFGFDTGSGGHDKLGHFYSSYIMTEFFYHRYRQKSPDTDASSLYPALFSWLIMFYVEVFDGYSADHGFSYEDLIMNSGGIAFAALRDRFPVLAERLDVRLEYRPSRFFDAKHPVTDYMHQKYLLSLKLAGFKSLASSPLAFLELHFGYYARGFKSSDRKEINHFVGVGLNLDELLWRPASRYWRYGRTPKYITDYYQIPDSYVDRQWTKVASDH